MNWLKIDANIKIDDADWANTEAAEYFIGWLTVHKLSREDNWS